MIIQVNIFDKDGTPIPTQLRFTDIKFADEWIDLWKEKPCPYGPDCKFTTTDITDQVEKEKQDEIERTKHLIELKKLISEPNITFEQVAEISQFLLAEHVRINNL